jgi:hypothetical protein
MSVNHHHLLSLAELLLFSFISGPIFSSYDATIDCKYEANMKYAESINSKQILEKQQDYASVYIFFVDAITNMI